ncbi:MAG: hypothetical protein KJI70_02640 [Patescibacteria group bacterium]|nr:hypothetical protein [Patescibacteria group bacterium]
MAYKIVVSGAAKTNHCCKKIEEICKEVGREIARHKCVLVTGGTTGVPYFATLGFKEVGGISIGFSPAISETAHIKTYRLPTKPFDVMVYTGADYTGRNMIMTKAADGVLVICGRMGTLHEFVTAFEIQKPVGVLEGTGGTADKIKSIVKGPYRGYGRVFYETEPKALVERLIKHIRKRKSKVGK